MARNIFSSINDSAQRNPWLFGAVSTGTRYFIGDMSVQRAGSKGGRLDYERLAMFTGFGGSYAATVGFTLYNRVYPRVLPTRPLVTAMLDAGVHTPTLYFLCFYGMQAVRQTGLQAALADPAAVARDAVATWKRNFWGDFAMSLCVWVPLHYMNFRFAPVHWRQPVVAASGLVWSGVMSVVRGAALTEDAGADEECEESSTGAAPAGSGLAGSVAVRRVSLPLASVVQAAATVPAATRASAVAAKSVSERAPRVWAAARQAPAAAAAAGAATFHRTKLRAGTRDVAAASCASEGLSGWPWR